ncbi:MAG: universal stress protein [Anaerolineales bacterium]|uniref:universal stress protein n=1 Tax=Promineifilum sp. TaxID=2664178 RepID=UPI001DFCE8CF|nr:universal stress protein [Anaerolineales bacterium]MCB8935030.1 universal stress protein [Promineifilum sp.]MCO5180996.1 universal stress protein [Promineifilum sp.]
MAAFRSILVPLDGSELAEKALAPARQIASAMAQRAGGENRTRLILLRAVSPMVLLAADPYLYDEMARMSADEAQAYLGHVASGLSDDTIAVETYIINGSPAEAIVQFATENGVDLIVMSSHGRTGSSRWVYGSVAEKVMHHAPCATAIIRAHVDVAMFQNRNILVPLDGSELAERALEPALMLAEAVNSNVYMLRIVSGREPMPESMSPAGEQIEAALGKADAEERAEAEGYLQRVYNAHENQHLFFDVQNTNGDTADAIISYAEQHKIDLIVMSSHGRSGIGRWLHGSVAEKVLRGADCATLIMREQE